MVAGDHHRSEMPAAGRSNGRRGLGARRVDDADHAEEDEFVFVVLVEGHRRRSATAVGRRRACGTPVRDRAVEPIVGPASRRSSSRLDAPRRPARCEQRGISTSGAPLVKIRGSVGGPASPGTLISLQFGSEGPTSPMRVDGASVRAMPSLGRGHQRAASVGSPWIYQRPSSVDQLGVVGEGSGGQNTPTSSSGPDQSAPPFVPAPALGRSRCRSCRPLAEAVTNARTVISLRVSVPVLSEQITAGRTEGLGGLQVLHHGIASGPCAAHPDGEVTGQDRGAVPPARRQPPGRRRAAAQRTRRGAMTPVHEHDGLRHHHDHDAYDEAQHPCRYSRSRAAAGGAAASACLTACRRSRRPRCPCRSQ